MSGLGLWIFEAGSCQRPGTTASYSDNSYVMFRACGAVVRDVRGSTIIEEALGLNFKIIDDQ